MLLTKELLIKNACEFLSFRSNVMTKTLKVLNILFSILAFVLLCVSTEDEHWTVGKNSSLRRSGLWRSCVFENCESFGTERATWLKFVRMLAVVACLSAAYGAFVAMLSSFDKIRSIFGSIFLFFASLCMGAALILYTIQMTHDGHFIFGWSYCLAVVGVLLAFAAGLTGIFIKKTKLPLDVELEVDIEQT